MDAGRDRDRDIDIDTIKDVDTDINVYPGIGLFTYLPIYTDLFPTTCSSI